MNHIQVVTKENQVVAKENQVNRLLHLVAKEKQNYKYNYISVFGNIVITIDNKSRRIISFFGKHFS